MAHPEAFCGFTCYPLDATGQEAGYLLVAENGAHLRLSASAHRLITAVASGMEFAAIAAASERVRGRAVAAAEVAAAYTRLLDQLEQARGTDRKKQQPPGFLGNWCWLPQPIVELIAARLAWLFAPGIVVGALAAVVVCGAVLGQRGALLSWEAAALGPGYALFVLSLLCHELGHASACARFGARPGGIGCTFYWFHPAFYSDVTAAWKLPRAQRVVVDLGGIYFQLLFAATCAGVQGVVDAPALSTAISMILFSCAVSLNPFFRFDGYWVLSDALGVTRLGSIPGRLIRHFCQRLRGHSPGRLPWAGGVLVLLVLYAPLCVGAWIYCGIKFLPFLGAQLLAYPALLSSLLAALTSWRWPAPGEVLHLFFTTSLLLILGRWLGSLWTTRATAPP